MPASTLRVKNSRTPMNYARQTAATVVGAVVRARASSLTICPCVCWATGASSDSIGLSRSLTASAQPLSARRADMNGTPPSPYELQQFRYSHFFGEDRVAAEQETFVTSRPTSATSSSETMDPATPLHGEEAAVSPRNYDGMEASYAVIVGAAEAEEFPQRIYRPYDPTADTHPSHTNNYTQASACPRLEIPIPDWRLDTDFHSTAQEDTIDVPDRVIPPRQPRHIIPNEEERRQGRVFDSLTDYTQPIILTHQRGNRGLVRTRRALPRP
ncbi:MAG: hypothetical protein Q9223_002575, partial [Gallowayella weberi]